MLSFFTKHPFVQRPFSQNFLYKFNGNATINWPILALTRFLLAFVVVAAHLVNYTDNPGPLLWINHFGAFNAILGFLLISGFSIGNSISRDSKGYLLRRAQRIYPVYIAAIILNLLANLPINLNVGFITKILINLLFLNQIFTDTSYVGPAWTLSLEIWLYLLAPLFLRMAYKQLLLISAVSFISYVFYTCGRTLFNWPYYSGVGFGLNLLLLSFIWILGFVLSVFTKKSKVTSVLITLVLVIHLLLDTGINATHKIMHNQFYALITQNTISFLFQLACLLFIISSVLHYKNSSIPTKKIKNVFNFLGNISYPLYLTHISTLELCNKIQIKNWLSLTFCCIAVACFVYWIFDFYSRKRTS